VRQAHPARDAASQMRRSKPDTPPARGERHALRNQATSSPMGAASVLCIVVGLSACGAVHRGNGEGARADARGGELAPLEKTAPNGPDGGRSTNKATTEARRTDSGRRPGVIAVVGQNSINKQTLDHWIKVEAAIQYQARPARPVPRGVVPDPPRYHDCVEYLAELEKARHARPTPNAASLKAQCERKRKSLSTQALEKLIVHYWIHEDAAKDGIKMTPRDVAQALDKRFPTEAGLHRFLAYTGMHRSDERVILEEELLRDKWQRAILPVYTRVRRIKSLETDQMVGEVDHELSMLTIRVTDKWTPQTHCRSAYVVRVCSEFAK
jgi:hypothetical protein